MLLTDAEIQQLTAAMPGSLVSKDARIIEAAVLEKLSQGVIVEPYGYYWIPDGRIHGLSSSLSKNTGPCHGWTTTPLYTADVIAAARVQENERCASLCETANSALNAIEVAHEIRALKEAT